MDKESIKSFVACQSRFCVVCSDMFLSAAAVIPLLVPVFDNISPETTSVLWLRNESIFFVQIFDYMEDPWSHVLTRTDQE